MLKIIDLNFTYSGQVIPVLNKINLHIPKGESVAILGLNGSGKTTLGYCLCGIIPKLIRGKIEGQIFIDGMDTKIHSFHEIIPNIGFIFQDSDSQFITLRVRDELLFGLENQNLSKDEIRSRFNQSVKNFNLDGLLDKSPQNLSMGQKQKVAIASVIAMKPKLLIFDEPTSALDPLERNNLINIIQNLKREGLTIIIFTHNFENAKSLADRILIIQNCEIIFNEKSERVNSNIVRKILKCGDVASIKKNYITAKPKIIIQNLSYKYQNSKQEIINNISFTVNQNEILGIVGSNGSGKSTLLSLISGLKKPKKGQIIIDDKNIEKMKFSEIAEKMSIVFQNPNHQIFAPTIYEELTFGLKNIRLNKIEIDERINEITNHYLKFLRKKDIYKDPHTLSFGQRKFLAMACAIAMKSEIILIDEPELGLDMCYRIESEKLLLDLNKSGTTIIIASHNLDLIERLTHRIIYLKNGKILKEGKTIELIGEIRNYFG